MTNDKHEIQPEQSIQRDVVVRIPFGLQKDERGRLRPIDLFLVKGALDLECPECGCKNEPTLFWYDNDGSGCVSRRYFYCCPNCKIHYTNWGEYYDWMSRKSRILKKCRQNSDHESQRLEFEKTIVIR